MRFLRLVLLFCLLPAIMPIESGSQTPTPTPQEAAAPPQARPKDVDSMEHIIAAVYDVISGPAASPRDWDRFRSLFAPSARLIPTRRAQDGKVSANSLTPDEYVARAQSVFEKDGFFESALANRIESWDRIAHVWSTYETRHAKGDKPFQRGINSFQLLFDGNRWWVITIYWEGEEAAHPLPEKYLSGGGN